MHKYRLELLLILAVGLLIGQLTWSTVVSWWHRPRAGAFGIDTYESNGVLASDYAIYLPDKYDNDTTAWPLVVFLHGSGDRGADPSILRDRGPFRVVQSGAGLPAILVGPQCRSDSDWQPEAVVRFIEHIAAICHVDRDRVYLVGESMGGYGTWHTAAANPKMFAAIVPICGGGEPNAAKGLTDLPVWAFHGAKDNVVPVVESERMVEAIRAAGGRPRLTVIPDMGHGICNDVCGRSDLWVWLFQQTRQGPDSQKQLTEAAASPDS